MTRRRPLKFLTTAAALPVIALLVAGCGGGSAPASTTPAAKPSGVRVDANNTLGQILVDSRGRTLYLFEGHPGACAATCAATWPPMLANGKRQVAYAGHPLYRYSGDQKPGDVNGEGVN